MSTQRLNVKAHEIMDPNIVAANQETTCRDIAFQLLSGLESGLPVTEPNREIVGVVTEFDLLKALEEERDLRTTKAEEIMSCPPITVDEETPIREVIRILRQERILSVPVVREGKLVGMIFRSTLLNHMINT